MESGKFAEILKEAELPLSPNQLIDRPFRFHFYDRKRNVEQVVYGKITGIEISDEGDPPVSLGLVQLFVNLPVITTVPPTPVYSLLHSKGATWRIFPDEEKPDGLESEEIEGDLAIL